MYDWKIYSKKLKKWMRLLSHLYTLVILEKFDIIAKDFKLNRLLCVIEEYDDVIFQEEE